MNAGSNVQANCILWTSQLWHWSELLQHSCVSFVVPGYGFQICLTVNFIFPTLSTVGKLEQ